MKWNKESFEYLSINLMVFVVCVQEQGKFLDFDKIRLSMVNAGAELARDEPRF